jgi:hypothetical protein
MPVDRAYHVLAHHFRIVAPRDLAGFFQRFLAPFEVEHVPCDAVYELRREPGTEKPWAMYLDGRSLHRGRTPARILEFTLWDISTKAIGSDHGCLAVHAAAASWRGSGIVMPAPPDSGKSTLVAGLTRAGCAYLSDEAALIEPATALLQPFPRSLWLARPSLEAVFPGEAGRAEWSTGREFHVRPTDLRPRAVGRPCRVRMVIAPRFERGAPTRLEPITRAEAVMTLARNTFHLDRFGGSAIELLGRVAGGAACHRLVYGNLSDAVGAVMEVARTDGSSRRGARLAAAARA